MARILIVGGGCRGRGLASELVGRGHVVRVSTRTEDGRAAIEAAGAECWIGTPQRMGTLRAALDGVALACWLLAATSGEEVRALHGALLERFMHQLIDTTVRGFVYEACPPPAPAGDAAVPAAVLEGGASIARTVGARNAIPVVLVEGPFAHDRVWLAQMRAAVRSLLGGQPSRGA